MPTPDDAVEPKKRGRPRKINSDGIKKQDREERVKKAPKGQISQQLEEISIYYPEQVFGPVPYNSFRVGNLWYKTFVQPGESLEDAYERAWEHLSNQVKSQYIAVRKDFWDRYNSMTLD